MQGSGSEIYCEYRQHPHQEKMTHLTPLEDSPNYAVATGHS